MILKELADLMDIACKSININYNDINVCELGNQIMKWHPARTGKKYLLDKGVKEHISIDMNGKDGALRIDLSKPINKWNKYFKMVTNYGTSEHVSDQYNVFRNIHNLTGIGGVMINVVPIQGGWANHCDFHYTLDFFRDLSNRNEYNDILFEERIISGKRKSQPILDRTVVCSIMVKNKDKDFIGEDSFYDIKGLYKK